MRITVAGASGFVGKHLINQIKSIHEVKALTRSVNKKSSPDITWKEVDLFSLSSTIRGLENTDVAIYFVHSMLPSSRMFQGSFHDTDLILADNFIQACKANHVKHIIYLGGVVPEGYISKHLESRKEVEDVLKSAGIPYTIFRSGLVVGDGGSSFEILKNLIHNLPIMLLPLWTKNITPIVFIDDLVHIMSQSIANTDYFNKTLNTVIPEELSYEDLIRKTISHLSRKSFLIPIPVNYTSFSKLWVAIFGASHYSLTSPLIDSLLCDFSTIKVDPMIKDQFKFSSYAAMLEKINPQKTKKKKSQIERKSNGNDVRSVQRLLTNTDNSVHKISNLYMAWLPKYVKSFIKIDRPQENIIQFKTFIFNKTLLCLEYKPQSDPNRIKFHIIGGLLVKRTDLGWLEFRNIGQGRFIIASINDYIPSLPWYIYKITQAPFHNIIMMKFGKYLKNRNTRRNIN